MIDIVSTSLNATSFGSPRALWLVLLAGSTSSIGPCTAPRLAAIVGILSQGPSRGAAVLIAAFVAGLMVAYGSFGLFAALIGQAVVVSRAIYIGVAGAMLVGGIMTLLRQTDHKCTTVPVAPRQKKSIGGVFLLGGSFAFVISPCCTPMIIAILAYGAQLHSVWYSASLLAVFALGHAIPLITLGSCTSVMGAMLTRFHLAEAFRVVGAVIMLALGGYYLCLA